MNTEGLTPDQIAQLAAQADQMREGNERAKKRPREGDDVFYLRSSGWIGLTTYRSSYKGELDQGNIFRTRPEAEAEGRYRAMRQRAREAFNAQNIGTYIGIQTGHLIIYGWDPSPYDLMMANLGIAFNNDDEGRALAQEALGVYQESIFKEFPR